jgi:uncharacterized membrane protein
MDTQMQVLTPHLDDPPSRSGARVTAIASVVGIVVSLRATWLKFRLDHLCDGAGCGGDAQTSWLTCDEALQSPLSTLATVPITALSAGLFILTLALSIALTIRKGPLWPAARPLLGLVSGAAAIVCAALALHAFTRFSHVCPYCVTLYITTLVIAAVGLRLTLAGRSLRRWSAAMRARSQAVLDASLLALTIFVLAVAMQTAAYRVAARSVRCPAVALTELPPPPTIRHRFADPSKPDRVRDLVILFADPACSTCRREVHALHQSQLRFLRDGPAPNSPWSGVELWVYPMPLDVCDDAADTTWFVDKRGNPLSSSEARRHNACLAARAAVCAAQQRPERAFEALDALFNLHDTPPPYFTYDKLRRVVLGQVSRDYDQPRLRACIDDPRTTATIAGYQRLFAELCDGRTSCTVPHALIVPVVDGLPRPELATAADTAAKLLGALQSPSP